MIRFEIDVPPSANHLYANVAGKGRIKTRKYRSWIKTAGWEAKAAVGTRKVEGAWALDISVNVHGNRDITNCIKAIEDLVVRLGLTADDRRNRDTHIALTKSIPRGRAVVVIEEA